MAKIHKSIQQVGTVQTVTLIDGYLSVDTGNLSVAAGPTGEIKLYRKLVQKGASNDLTINDGKISTTNDILQIPSTLHKPAGDLTISTTGTGVINVTSTNNMTLTSAEDMVIQSTGSTTEILSNGSMDLNATGDLILHFDDLSTTPKTNASHITLTAGSSSGNIELAAGASGTITMDEGSGGVLFEGGTKTIKIADGNINTETHGADMTISAGHNGTGNGGILYLWGGGPTTAGNGGHIYVQGGHAAGDGDGGDVYLYGGAAAGTQENGGSIYLTTGFSEDNGYASIRLAATTASAGASSEYLKCDGSIGKVTVAKPFTVTDESKTISIADGTITTTTNHDLVLQANGSNQVRVQTNEFQQAGSSITTSISNGTVSTNTGNLTITPNSGQTVVNGELCVTTALGYTTAKTHTVYISPASGIKGFTYGNEDLYFYEFASIGGYMWTPADRTMVYPVNLPSEGTYLHSATIHFRINGASDTDYPCIYFSLYRKASSGGVLDIVDALYSGTATQYSGDGSVTLDLQDHSLNANYCYWFVVTTAHPSRTPGGSYIGILDLTYHAGFVSSHWTA